MRLTIYLRVMIRFLFVKASLYTYNLVLYRYSLRETFLDRYDRDRLRSNQFDFLWFGYMTSLSQKQRYTFIFLDL